MEKFTSEERIRYARQMALPDFGAEGQERLQAARVLLIGAGGLGSPAALYLAAAGVGTLGLVDPDKVELSNLQRQILHGTKDVGRPKVQSGAESLAGINPHVRVQTYHESFTAAGALQRTLGWHVVIDGSDNFSTRYASNDACVAHGIPNVYGSVWRFEGQISVFDPARGGPCYRCLNPEAPAPGTVPGCNEAGVLGVVPGLVGMMQALEAIKLITGMGQPMVGRLLHLDALAMKFREFHLRRDPQCRRCAPGRSKLPIVEEGTSCAFSPGMTDKDDISVQDLAGRRASSEAYVLLDVREDWELEAASLQPCLHIPLNQVTARSREIPRDIPVYVICHGGVRSAHAVELLGSEGYDNVLNVRGGIAAWSEEVDASVPSY